MKKKTTLLVVLIALLAGPATASVLAFLEEDRLTVVRDDGRVILTDSGVTDVAVSTDLVAYRKKDRLRLVDRSGRIVFTADRVEHYQVGDSFVAVERTDHRFLLVSQTGKLLVRMNRIEDFRLVQIPQGPDFVLVTRDGRTHVLTASGHVIRIRQPTLGRRSGKVGIVIREHCR